MYFISIINNLELSHIYLKLSADIRIKRIENIIQFMLKFNANKRLLCIFKSLIMYLSKDQIIYLYIIHITG